MLFDEYMDIDPNIRNGDGATSLHVACFKGHIECVKILAEHPQTDMGMGKLRAGRNETPMFAACCYGHLNIAKFLFKLHMAKELTSPKHKEEHNKDPFSLRKRLVLEFLSKSESTTSGMRDDTLLTISTFNGHRDMVEWLISLGVDLDEPNSAGLTAVTIATDKNNVFLVKLLTNAGGHGAIGKVHHRLRKRKETDMVLNRRGQLPSGVRKHISSFLNLHKKTALRF
jgi:ankyrin repeat protein